MNKLNWETTMETSDKCLELTAMNELTINITNLVDAIADSANRLKHTPETERMLSQLMNKRD